MLDSSQAYLHHPADVRTASVGGAASGAPSASAGAAPAPLLRAALRDLRTFDLERRRSRFSTSGTGLADVPARDREDAGAEPDECAGLLAQLRAATTMQARALHAAGEPPERVIAQVKQTMQVALAQEGWSDPAAIDGIMRRVVRWSIVAYYDA